MLNLLFKASNLIINLVIGGTELMKNEITIGLFK